jgi:hypothetical protein
MHSLHTSPIVEVKIEKQIIEVLRMPISTQEEVNQLLSPCTVEEVTPTNANEYKEAKFEEIHYSRELEVSYSDNN